MSEDYVMDPVLIYRFVGMALIDDEWRVVTRQCGSKANAAREALKYAEQHKVSRFDLKVHELCESDFDVVNFDPHIDERTCGR
jgi:hypothetical protein